MIIDTEKLFAAMNRDLAECQRTLDSGMFPQVMEDARDERRELRDLKTWLARIETYAAVQPISTPEDRSGEHG